jgi:hypothetical protein
MTDLRSDHFDVAPGAQGPGASTGAGYAPPPPPPAPSATPGTRRSRPLLAAAAVAGALIAGVGVGVPIGFLTRDSAPTPSSTASVAPSPASGAAAQARALYQQAIAAASASAGFHYVAVSHGGIGNQTIAGDAGRDGGTQEITMDSTYGPEQFSLVLVGGTVYFHGNGPGLQDQLGVPAATAAGLVGKWISVSSGDGPYGVVAPGITVTDQVGETGLVPASSRTLSAGTQRISGTVPAQLGGSGQAHLDIAASSHLPISYVSTLTGGGVTSSSTNTFSNWGNAPSVTAPSGAVAWSTLGASEPPGGYGTGGSAGSPTPQT